MSTIRSDSFFAKPQRKNRPVPKKTTKHSTEKDSKLVNNNSKYSLVLTKIDNNSQVRKQREEQDTERTMITRNRITTQAGIFNMAKVSKTVSRGPLTSNNDTMMDQEDSSMISRVINQNSLPSLDQSMQTQEQSQMDISKSDTPECDPLTHPARGQSQNKPPTQEDSTKPEQSLEQIPFKEIEHNLLHAINPEDYLKRSNTLSLVKRDLHATIKRNIPHEIYLQFFKKGDPPQQPAPPSLPDKRAMPLQPSRLANRPLPQDRKLSEWTVLMGTFSSQEDEDNSQSLKADCKSNVISMMETDLPLTSLSQQVYDSGLTKPDYLDSPTPVTMYPHKMF